jgi:hypothetical protein
MTNELIRTVEIFDRTTDELVAEYPLAFVELSFLQTLFGEPKDDPMVFCYKLDSERARKLQPYVSSEIDTEKYDCFLSCYVRS